DDTVDVRMRTQGSVLNGGSISLNAIKARIVTDAGSVMDVSATQHSADLPGTVPTAPYVAQSVWSDAGSISVSSTEATRLDGTLSAKAAGQGAGGGFNLTFLRAGVGAESVDRESFAHRIVVRTANQDAVATGTADGAPVVTAQLSAQALGSAGFDS